MGKKLIGRFSGNEIEIVTDNIVIKVSNDGERYKIARFFC